MSTNYYKNKHLHLSQKCIDDYPSHFKQDYKHYELLQCAVCLNDRVSPHNVNWFTGRFMGIYTNQYCGVTYLQMYKTSCNTSFSFDLLNRIECSILLDDRYKYQSRQYPIYPMRSRICINLYPLYQKELLLLYFHLLTQKTSLLPECMGIISNYLKPSSFQDYELIWDIGQNKENFV